MDRDKELEVLRRINFDWTRHIDSVWSVNAHDVPEIHADLRHELAETLTELSDGPSALGEVITGPAGSGKTHFLGALRQHLMAQGHFFVLVDMTDVRDFWDTVRLGHLDSINRLDETGEPQFRRALAFLLGCVESVKDPRRKLAELKDLSSERLISKYVDGHVLRSLSRRFRNAVSKHKDVLRALFLINADDFLIKDVGDSWLQGIGIEDEERDHYSFAINQPDPRRVVEGLSWVMSQVAPTLLAFDQLDAIVAQHHIASAGIDPDRSTEEERASASIIEGVAGGLMAVRDVTRRTLSVVSCLDTTWQILEQRAVASFADRFSLPPRRLPVLTESALGERMIMERIQEACKRHAFKPTSPSWPYKRHAFDAMPQMLPRELLKACDRSRRACLEKKIVGNCDPFEVASTPETPQPQTIEFDRRFRDLKAQAPLDRLLDPEQEDTLADQVMEAACRCLIKEHPGCDQVDFVVDEDFGTSVRSPTLHVRIRLIFHAEGDREKHFSFRVLQKSHARAFQSRLKAAITASGIDQRIGYRRLIIVRRDKIPGGRVTAKLWSDFLVQGGIWAQLGDDQWRALWAIAQLEKENAPEFEPWLQAKQPVRRLAVFTTCLAGEALDQACNRKFVLKPPGINAEPAPAPPEPVSPEPPQIEPAPKVPDSDDLLIGKRILAAGTDEPVSLSLKNLTRHVVALAGSGSGKTVLIRRLIESAALAGIPSIVIDPANDLARLGDPWPRPHPAWMEGDEQRAERYRRTVDVRVWTPGREAGRPLHLSPLPDLAAVVDDTDELDAAVSMAQEALREIAAPGKSAGAQTKLGVLASSLRYLAQHGGGDLERLIGLLTDLPMEAGGGISKAEKLGGAIADQLRAAVQTDPLLRGKGAPLDPSELFGIGADQTRISVINLHGLPSLVNQQRFLGQLAMALFTWIKRNPAPSDFPIRGLLVIDEAKDFVPATGAVASKAPLMRLAAQARKYGLGLVFATQAPKSIHHEIIANCTTHFYGKASSPAAIEVIRGQLNQRGTGGQEVPKLERGQFYVYSEGFPQPVKVAVPMCLTHHAETPLTEDEVVSRAKRGR